MSAQTRTLYGIIGLLVAVIVVVSGIAALYYFQYSQAESANQTYVSELRVAGTTYQSSVLIDYGNGTRKWFNDTKVEPGWNLYVMTKIITNGHVNATYYPQYQSHFVNAIYNVADTNSLNWLIWTYNRTASWQQAQVGPDQLPMNNGSVYAWTYCGSNCTAP